MPATENELDFWSDDIKVEVLSPLMILRAQVPALRKKTKGILQAKVETLDTQVETVHEFSLIAPALDNYKEKILTATHKKNIVYPCTIESPGLERVVGNHFEDSEISNVKVAWTQTEFINILREALQSDIVRSTIDSFLAKSNEKKADDSSA